MSHIFASKDESFAMLCMAAIVLTSLFLQAGETSHLRGPVDQCCVRMVQTGTGYSCFPLVCRSNSDDARRGKFRKFTKFIGAQSHARTGPGLYAKWLREEPTLLAKLNGGRMVRLAWNIDAMSSGVRSV
ncbi:hypothetical protein C8Q76DRAFT_27379 [Earliella scabrosa]|nr:hypothetical protein C8Q76DRAFT_27379 [Earliella scabrosa]